MLRLIPLCPHKLDESNGREASVRDDALTSRSQVGCLLVRQPAYIIRLWSKEANTQV